MSATDELTTRRAAVIERIAALGSEKSGLVVLAAADDSYNGRVAEIDNESARLAGVLQEIDSQIARAEADADQAKAERVAELRAELANSEIAALEAYLRADHMTEIQREAWADFEGLQRQIEAHYSELRKLGINKPGFAMVLSAAEANRRLERLRESWPAG